MNFQTKIASAVSVFLIMSGGICLNNCTPICRCPDFIMLHTDQYEACADQLLSVRDSINEMLQGAYHFDKGSMYYEINSPEKNSSNSVYPIAQQLVDLNITKVRILDNNVWMIYSYDKNFIRGTVLSKYLIFENEPVNLWNSEGDLSWKILCDNKISTKLRHIVEEETI